MNVLGLENLSKYRMLMFVFKNKKYFDLHNSEKCTRLQGALVVAYPKWRKLHSRIQARYRGYELFNRLPVALRNEQKLTSFKQGLRTRLQVDYSQTAKHVVFGICTILASK